MGTRIWFIEEVRNNRKKMSTEEAVDKAIEDMPEGFVIKSFLKYSGSVVKTNY